MAYKGGDDASASGSRRKLAGWLSMRLRGSDSGKGVRGLGLQPAAAASDPGAPSGSVNLCSVGGGAGQLVPFASNAAARALLNRADTEDCQVRRAHATQWPR